MISSNRSPANIQAVSGDLFDLLGDIALRFDATGHLTYANLMAAELLGDRLTIGAPWREFMTRVAPRLAEGLPGTVPAARSKQGHWRGPVKLIDAAGHGEVFTGTIAVDNRMSDPRNGTPNGYFAIFRSLSETRRREHAERELAYRDEFVARLGHELRTPLNAVLGF